MKDDHHEWWTIYDECRPPSNPTSFYAALIGLAIKYKQSRAYTRSSFPRTALLAQPHESRAERNKLRLDPVSRSFGKNSLSPTGCIDPTRGQPSIDEDRQFGLARVFVLDGFQEGLHVALRRNMIQMMLLFSRLLPLTFNAYHFSPLIFNILWYGFFSRYIPVRTNLNRMYLCPKSEKLLTQIMKTTLKWWGCLVI